MKETKETAMIYATAILLDQDVMNLSLLTSICKRQKKLVFLTETNVSTSTLGIMDKVLANV